MKKNLLTTLKYKKEAHKMLKEGQMTLKNVDIAWVCREGARKSKAHLELSLAMDVKDNEKGFPYVSRKKDSGKYEPVAE